VKKEILALLAVVKMTKNKALLAVLLALMAFAGNASAYTATYTSDDLGTAIVDLIVTFIVAVTGKAPTLAGLVIVLMTVVIIGTILTALAAAAGIAMGVVKLKPSKKG
jgi:hypothetical protein